jgi:hypothetical protein
MNIHEPRAQAAAAFIDFKLDFKQINTIRPV